MIIDFPMRADHAVTPSATARLSGSRAAKVARTSNVISLRPLAAAIRANARQCAPGMPRSRHPLTVESAKTRKAATFPVPPSASMIEAQVNVMGDTIVRSVRTSQEFAGRETTIPLNNARISGMIDPPEIIGPRLKALRIALGYKKQTDFAKAIGVEKNTYNPWEKGKGGRELTFEGACLIRAKFKIPLDYLFFGDHAEEMPAKVYKILVEAA